MPTVTLTVSDDVKAGLKKFSWVNWSEIAREELISEEKAFNAFEQFKKLVSKSQLTEKDADILARKVKLDMHKQLKKAGEI